MPRSGDLVISRWSARFMGRRFPCAAGRGGVGVKRREGDGITPVGTFQIEWIYARPDRLAAGFPLETRAIRPGEFWSEDPADPDYNHPVRRNRSFAAETLRRADRLYDLVAVLDFNRHPVLAGKGSAIFLHLWRKPRCPTAGCVAFSRHDLIWILQRWSPKSRVIIR